MSNSKKMIQAAAGNAGGGAGPDVEDVFSTYLYEGNGSTQTITNGIDLDGEGGFVWIKARTQSNFHYLFDTEATSNTSALLLPLTSGASASTTALTSFNSDGFSLGSNGGVNGTQDMVSWTFRKAPKFFDVVTYTGTGSPTTISHDLGSEPGMIIVKRTSGSEAGGIAGWWVCYHRGLSTPESGAVFLNSTDGRNVAGVWNNTAPTSTEFTVNNNYVNYSGDTYVAYLFAHNDGDGDFGPNGDADIIKCGSYTGNGSNDGPEIDLGFEPQWLLIKDATSSSWNWMMVDAMRGCPVDGPEEILMANTSGASQTPSTITSINLTPTGFKIADDYGAYNTNGNTYIYMAIRRGTKVPESATEVFAPDFSYNTDTNYQAYLGATADMWILKSKNVSSNWANRARLTGGNYRAPNLTSVDVASTYQPWDNNEGYENDVTGTPNTNLINYLWKRAPNFFDVVCYEWNGTATRNVEHNLGVPPEMYIVKRRNSSSSWYVRHKDFFGTNGSIVLNTTAATAQTGVFTTGGTTDTTFPVANDGSVNASGGTYVAYLFASLPGISKVGSYTGNGSSQTINCGFTSGARFILIKRTDSAGDWYVWDTERGIVAGNDPHLSLNTTAAEVTTDDSIDPDSSGFIVNQVSATNINVSSAEYIFYAIA